MDSEEWRDIVDSQDRKKIQNRLAQRRRRERLKHGDGFQRRTSCNCISTSSNESTNSSTEPPRKDMHDPNGATATLQWSQHTDLEAIKTAAGLSTFPELELDALSDPVPLLDHSPSTSLSDRSPMDATCNPCSNLVTQCDNIHYYTEMDGQPSLDATFLSDINRIYSPAGSTIAASASPKCSSTLASNFRESLMDSDDNNNNARTSPPDRRLMDREPQKHENRVRGAPPESESSVEGSSDYSAKFDHIFNAMKAVGFGSFDQMAMSYYTANFARSSVAHDMQRQSRIRHLRNFLASIKSNAKSWSVRERRGWLEEVIEEAEDLHIDEIHKLLDGVADGSIEDITGAKIDSLTRKAFYQEHLPDLWSLLSRVVAASGVEQPQSTKVVLVALQILLESDSTA